MGWDEPLIVLGLCVVIAVAGCTQPAPPGDDADGADGMDGADGGEPPANGDTDTDGDAGAPGPVPVEWRDHPHLGSILTDADGSTLYVFTRDEAGASACTGGCAANWPPLTVGAALDGSGGLFDRLGTAQRDDGSLQVTIDGRPLYFFAADEAPGDANGQGRNGVWFVVREADDPGTLNADILDGPGAHDVTSGELEYSVNATGWFARPADGRAYPGVVMVHEWWGLNDHIRAMADALASHGYAVVAVDLFNGSVATDPDGARAQVQGLDQVAAVANMREAATYLRTEAGSTAIASLGWCFGGGQSLQLAISGERLNATVLYYGTPLVTDEAQLAVIDWPVQGVFGDQDRAIPLELVEAFDGALTNLSIEHEVHVYEDVGHAFANPSGQAYGAAQAMDAWAKTLAFLDANLKGAPA